MSQNTFDEAMIEGSSSTSLNIANNSLHDAILNVTLEDNYNNVVELSDDDTVADNSQDSNESRTQYSDKNLIINYVPSHFSDEDLTRLFNSIGPTKSCRIIRDKVTQQSYGFGFCEFNNAADANLAIEQLNGYHISNKQLKVAFARLPGQESKNCNLFIQNIPIDVTHDEIYRVFSRYGNIVQCRRIDDKEGNSRRISFVLFESRTCAEAAKNDLNDSSWPYNNENQQIIDNNSLIQVQFAAENSKKLKPIKSMIIPNQQQQQYQPSCSNINLSSQSQFSNGILPQNNNNNNFAILNNYLSNNNYVAAAAVANQQHHMNGTTSNQSQMFEFSVNQMLQRLRNIYSNGFVQNAPQNVNTNLYGAGVHSTSPNGVIAANNHLLNGHNMNGVPGAVLNSHFSYGGANQSQLIGHGTHNNAPNIFNPYILTAKPTIPAQHQNHENAAMLNINNTSNHCVLYVYNTGNDMTEEKLRELFQMFSSSIIKVDVPRDGAQIAKSKNYSFVTMADYNSALASLNRLNGMIYYGKKLQVSFRKEKQQQQLQAMMLMNSMTNQQINNVIGLQKNVSINGINNQTSK